MLPETLTDRRRRVMRIVVQEYIQNAQPVSSKTIVDKYQLGVSPATIRNDLAALEEEGFLTHPHTSAGRVPTEAGYRYFVQYLLADEELPLAERRLIRTQLTTAHLDLDQWLRLTTSVLARTSQAAALATLPRASQSQFKHVELISIYGSRVIMVLVLQAGIVKQHLLDLEEPISQAELSQVSNELNEKLAAKSSAAILQSVQTLSPLAQHASLLITELMENLDQQVSHHIYRDGLAQVLEAPEFAEGDSVRTLVQVLEERTLLQQIVNEFGQQGTVQVVIAGDGRYTELQAVSIVIGRYGVAGRATGVLGVVGPLRMSYGRTIGAVRYVSSLMSDLVQEMYGL